MENQSIQPKSTKGGKRPGAGRPKGSLDQGNAALREMILKALDNAGGIKYLSTIAKENPGPFLSLLGKVLPTTLTGHDGGPIETVTRVELVAAIGNRED